MNSENYIIITDKVHISKEYLDCILEIRDIERINEVIKIIAEYPIHHSECGYYCDASSTSLTADGDWYWESLADKKLNEAKDLLEKAERKYKKAKEEVEKIERENNIVKQCEKDLQFIKDTLRGLKHGNN